MAALLSLMELVLESTPNTDRHSTHAFRSSRQSKSDFCQQKNKISLPFHIRLMTSIRFTHTRSRVLYSVSSPDPLYLWHLRLGHALITRWYPKFQRFLSKRARGSGCRTPVNDKTRNLLIIATLLQRSLPYAVVSTRYPRICTPTTLLGEMIRDYPAADT